MAIKKITLTEDHLRLISNIKFEKFVLNDSEWSERFAWGIDQWNMFGGTYVLEDVSIIIGKYDLAIEVDGANGPRFSKEVEDYKVNHTDLVFVLHSVDNLVRNGRLNKIVGSAINILGIKIVGRASVEGTLEPFSKVRALSKVYKCFLSEMDQKGYNGGKVLISHANNEKDALELEKLILEKYSDAQIEIVKAKGLVSYYAEEKGILMAFEH